MKKLFAIFLLLIGLSAIAGGIGLLTPGSIGIPTSDLEGSIFSSYLWPGIILAVIVGGAHISAALALFSSNKYELEFAAVAGFGLQIWLFTEICIVGYHNWLQPLYFAFATITLITVLLFLKHKQNGIINL